jgi:protein TonB
LSSAYSQLYKPKKAVKAGQKALELAEDPASQALARYAIGSAHLYFYSSQWTVKTYRIGATEPVKLLQFSSSTYHLTDRALRKAEAAFRAAIQLRAGEEPAHVLALAASLVARMRIQKQQNSWGEILTLLGGVQDPDPAGFDAEWLYHLLGPATKTDERPYAAGDSISAPKRLSGSDPQYSHAANSARVQGTVKVRILIDREGRVGILEVVKGLPQGLTEQALSAITRWRYEPTIVSGKPVSMRHTITITFQLPDKPRVHHFSRF